MHEYYLDYLHNNFMIREMLIKPSQFYILFTSLYPCAIIWQIMKRIAGRSCVFSYNYDNVVFTWISGMIYIKCPKTDDGVLKSLQMDLIYISLCFQYHFFILNGLNLIVTPCDGLSMLFLYLLNGLLMVVLHFACCCGT